MGYKRWYDQDAKFGEVVRAMEFMTLESRQAFAIKLYELSEEMLQRHGDKEKYLEALEAEHAAFAKRLEAFGECPDALDIWSRLGITAPQGLPLLEAAEFLEAVAQRRAG